MAKKMGKKERQQRAEGFFMIMGGIVLCLPGVFYGLQAWPFILGGGILIPLGIWRRSSAMR